MWDQKFMSENGDEGPGIGGSSIRNRSGLKGSLKIVPRLIGSNWADAVHAIRDRFFPYIQLEFELHLKGGGVVRI